MWRPGPSMESSFALSQGPPVHVMRRVDGSSFAIATVPVSTDAPSPGMPVAAAAGFPVPSTMSTVTSSAFRWSSLTRTVEEMRRS